MANVSIVDELMAPVAPVGPVGLTDETLWNPNPFHVNSFEPIESVVPKVGLDGNENSAIIS